MSVRFHINPETGQVGKCSATEGRCPFKGSDGNEAQHYATEADARKAYEEKQGSSVGKTLKKEPETPKDPYEGYDTKIPRKIYEKRLIHGQSNGSLKIGDTLLLKDKEYKILGKKSGYKNVNLNILELPDGKERNLALPIDGQSDISTLVETDESKDRQGQYYDEISYERIYRNYNENEKAEAVNKLKEKVDKGQSLRFYDIEELIDAEAKQEVIVGFKRRVEKVKEKFPEEEFPYTKAYEDYKKDLQDEISSKVSYGTSQSTSEMSNLFDRSVLAYKAKFSSGNRIGTFLF